MWLIAHDDCYDWIKTIAVVGYDGYTEEGKGYNDFASVDGLMPIKGGTFMAFLSRKWGYIEVELINTKFVFNKSRYFENV